MKVVIVGGGKVGSHLARVLSADRQSVVVIERDATHAGDLAEDLPVLVLHGDGTDVRLLEEADCKHADFLVAVTGSDEDNLVACQLARTAFDCENVLARVNDPRNERTFQALDVPLISVTGLIVEVLNQQLDSRDRTRIVTLGKGEASLIEIEVPERRSPAAVASLGLPDSTIIAALKRNGKVLVPAATDQIRPGDRVMVVTTSENEEGVRSVITGEYK